MTGERALATTSQLQKDEISLRLTIVSRMMRNMFDRQVAQLNITRSQWTMIVVVSRHPGVTQRVIAEILEMSEASAGRLIDRLCGEGLLERRPRPDDRRAYAVYLTEAAQPLLDNLTSAGRALEKKLFNGFGDEDLERLASLLDRMYENLNRG